MRVLVFEDRAALGRAAAAEIARFLRERAEELAAVFAAAPSQTETLAALAEEPGIAWNRLTAFHLDEYVGAGPDSSHSFRKYLVDNLFRKVKPARFEGLRGEAADLAAECARYGAEWKKAAPVVGLIGIGENGHIAFNDPPDSRFDDPDVVRVAKLTEECRVQQVHDGTFPSFEAVPGAALTVTIPAILNIGTLFVMGAGPAEGRGREGDARRPCHGGVSGVHLAGPSGGDLVSGPRIGGAVELTGGIQK